jgi:hypothetical protein
MWTDERTRAAGREVFSSVLDGAAVRLRCLLDVRRMTEPELCQWLRLLFDQRTGAVFTSSQLFEIRMRIESVRRTDGGLPPFTARLDRLLAQRAASFDPTVMAGLRRDLDEQLDKQSTTTTQLRGDDLRKLLDDTPPPTEQQAKTTRIKTDDLRKLLDEVDRDGKP